MDMSSLSSKYDWDIRRGGPSSPPLSGRDMSPPGMGSYRDPDITIRSMGSSMIEVRVLDLNTGRRTAKMFDLYHDCGIGPGMGMSMGFASMGINSCLADVPSSENESVSKKLLKLFL